MGKAKKIGGAGLGYRREFLAILRGETAEPPPSLGFLEAVSENFLPTRSGARTRPLENLLELRRDYPLALHGVSLSLGSVDPLDRSYLARLKALVGYVEPWQVSDHLCWTSFRGENLHDLLPIPFHEESLRHLASRIQEAQDVLGRPLALENISAYLEAPGSTMSEAAFLNELVSRTGCSLLLDINNIYINAVNFGRDPLHFLGELGLEAVSQIHLAGHVRGASGLLLDTHGAPVCAEVWELFAWALARVGREIPTMIERDQNFPAWAELAAELARIEDTQEAAERERRRNGACAMARAAELTY